MPENPARVQYFHLTDPIPVRELPNVAYKCDSVEHRGFCPFEEPVTETAQITGDHIPGAILRVPGQHPFDTRWSCVDPEYALHLPLREDNAWVQDAMKTSDDPLVASVRTVPHYDENH
jgi:hypothetical protein